MIIRVIKVTRVAKDSSDPRALKSFRGPSGFNGVDFGST